MKSIRNHASAFFTVLALAGLLFSVVPNLGAQTAPAAPPAPNPATSFNPPPCDYKDQFYEDNGLNPADVVGRFGTARQTGPPATGSEVNWVADANCSVFDPNRRNFRILATTGGFSDDQLGNPGHFISLIGFVTTQTAFETTYSRTVGAINGGLDNDQQNVGETISIADSANPRSITMQNLVSNFEAYPATKQKLANGTFALNPCQTDMQSPLAPPTPCFELNNVSDVYTPNLRQDWRFATNRNAMDGSDNNCINISNDPVTGVPFCGPPNAPEDAAFSDSPFGYFCDDLLGMWINSYFWYVVNPLTEPKTTTCGQVFATLAARNGLTTDGTPIVKTGEELDDDLEANNCAAEGQEAMDGSDGGAIWDVCPAIPDPTDGAITTDAFLDQVKNANGTPQNALMTAQFLSLQKTGQFPANEGPTVPISPQPSVVKSSNASKAAAAQRSSSLN